MKHITIITLIDDFGTVFFDANDKFIGYVHTNDGDWRQEYFAPMFKAAEIIVSDGPLTEGMFDQIAAECNFDLDELDFIWGNRYE